MKEIIDNSIFTLIERKNNLTPLQEYTNSFRHLIQDTISTLLRGEMPHLIKKIVNALERSGSVISTDLSFRGQPITLKMIHQLWLRKQSQSKFGSIKLIF